MENFGEEDEVVVMGLDEIEEGVVFEGDGSGEGSGEGKGVCGRRLGAAVAPVVEATVMM